MKELCTVIIPSFNSEKTIKAAVDSALAQTYENIEILIRISIFHYLIGYIHPFYNGNGRLSRFVSSYLLSRDLEPLLSYRLSYTIKENIKVLRIKLPMKSGIPGPMETERFVMTIFVR